MQSGTYNWRGRKYRSSSASKIYFLIYPYTCVFTLAQSGVTLCDSMDHSLTGSSIHGIFQVRILECIAISSSREFSRPRDWTHVSCTSCIGKQILYHCTTWEAPQTHNKLNMASQAAQWQRIHSQCRRHKRLGFHSWSRRSPGGGNDCPLQYSCLENSMDREAWWAIVHGITRS